MEIVSSVRGTTNVGCGGLEVTDVPGRGEGQSLKADTVRKDGARGGTASAGVPASDAAENADRGSGVRNESSPTSSHRIVEGDTVSRRGCGFTVAPPSRWDVVLLFDGLGARTLRTRLEHSSTTNARTFLSNSVTVICPDPVVVVPPSSDPCTHVAIKRAELPSNPQRNPVT